MAYSTYPGSSFPLTAAWGPEVERSSKGRLAALGLVCGGSPGLPGPVPTCSLQHLHLESAWQFQPMSPPCPPGQEPWAGFAPAWARPTAGGRARKRTRCTGGARLAEGTKAASGWAAANACPGCSLTQAAKSPSQERTGWRPPAEGEGGRQRAPGLLTETPSPGTPLPPSPSALPVLPSRPHG